MKESLKSVGATVEVKNFTASSFEELYSQLQQSPEYESEGANKYTADQLRERIDGFINNVLNGMDPETEINRVPRIGNLRELAAKLLKKEKANLKKPGVILDQHGNPYQETGAGSAMLIELLNKARQESKEQDIYWHVFGKGLKSGEKYPPGLVNRPDLLEKFAVGKNGEPYTDTHAAAHDLIEFLTKEAEGNIKDSEKTKKREKNKKEAESWRNIIELLNKARQKNLEQDVYWHVFGKGKTGLPYPESWVNRKDLLEKFAVGKNGEPYTDTHAAAHDLIEFLTKEAEGKIKDLTSEEKTPQEKPGTKTPEGPKPPEQKEQIIIIFIDLLEKARGGDPEAVKILIEFIITHKIEIKITGTEPTPEEEQRQKLLIILLEQLRGGDITVINQLIQVINVNINVINITVINVPPGQPPQPPQPPTTPEKVKTLEELRDEYLKAKRLRGNVFRGMFGRLFGRKLIFGKDNMDFGGKQGAKDLEKVRGQYQEILKRYRSEELTKLQATLDTRVASGTMTVAERTATMQSKMVELLTEEQKNIDTRAVNGIEKNLFEKMKTKWRQLGKTRMIAGALLGGAAALTGGTAVGAALVGMRAGMGGVGTYIGVEAALERYGKTLGHVGMINEINKKGPFATMATLETYVAGLPNEDVKKEAARLRMLHVEKGVAINNVNSLGAIAKAILKRDYELAAQDAMNTQGLENPALAFAERLSNRLALEIDARNALVEKEVDKERIKKMFRKTTAALAGGAVGWLIGGKLFQSSDTIDARGVARANITERATGSAVTSSATSTAENAASSYSTYMPEPYKVSGGDNLWKIIESKLDSGNMMAGLAEGNKTHIIDTLKDSFDNMSPAELKELGFRSGDADLLYVGDSLNLSKVFENPGVLLKGLFEAHNVSPEEIAGIVKNNAKISKWLVEHRSELKGVYDSAMIDKVLRGVV